MALRILVAITSFAGAAATGITGPLVWFSGPTLEQLMLGIGGFLIVELLLIYAVFDRSAPVFGRIFWKGPKDLFAISITFDDGPNEPYSSRILDILKSLDVKATFFVLGERAERFPDMVRRAVTEGHEIGNHTYNHEVLPLKSPSYIRDQIQKTTDLVEKISGARPRLFRAPHGWRNPWLNRSALTAGCTPVAWTLGVWDTDRPGADVIVQRTLKGLKNGCVLLFHDGCGTQHGADASQLVEALPVIVKEAQRLGYKFLKLSDMIQEASWR